MQKFRFKILLLLTLLLIIANVSRTEAYNSLIEYETANQELWGFDYIGGLDFGKCFSSGQVMYPWEYGDFNQTQIATVIGKDVDIPAGSNVGTIAAVALVARAAVYAGLAGLFPVGTVLALLAGATEYLIMLDVCTNSFVIAPHEYVNVFDRGMGCGTTIQSDGSTKKYYFESQDGLAPFTVQDIPYFYHCDPTYDPVSSSTLSEGGEDAALIGRTWGYIGGGAEQCNAEMAQYVNPARVGTVNFAHIPLGIRLFEPHQACESFKDYTMTLRPGEITFNFHHYYAYYRFGQDTGKLQLCVATPYTLLPVRVGCSSVPPPNEKVEVDPLIEAFVKDTVCEYFLTGRTDLQSLGNALPNLDNAGNDKTYVKKFLQSEFHITSTVVGCVKDQLARSIVNPSTSFLNESESFFESVQKSFKAIVLAALVLYVSIIGIQIISNPQPLKRGEAMMWISKFALVVYFTSIHGWYEINQNGEKSGLYSALLYGADEVASLFLDAQTSHNPLDFCNYNFQGENLIKERNIPASAFGSGTEATKGSGSNIRMTVWDTVDCKVVNYLNFGTCRYKFEEMLPAWVGLGAVYNGGLGVLLAIASFLYLFMLLLIIFRFTHTVLLASLVITLLVLISPLAIICALFKPTAGVFQQWFRSVIGYFLYPALLFAFLSLIMAAFDSVYFGPIDMSSPDSMLQSCKDDELTSMYCIIVRLTDNPNPCRADNILEDLVDHQDENADLSTRITNAALTEAERVAKLEEDPNEEEKTYTYSTLRGSITLKQTLFDEILLGILKSLFFVILFYFYMDLLDDIISIMMGVRGLGAYSKGTVNVANIAGAGAGVVGKAAAKGARKGAEKVGDAIKGKNDGK